MDLICNSYANDSDDEPGPVADKRFASVISPPSIPLKRPYPGPEDRQYKAARRPNPPSGTYPDPQTSSSAPTPISVPGRYVSKRERSLLASLSTAPNQNQATDSIRKPSVSSPTGTSDYP